MVLYYFYWTKTERIVPKPTDHSATSSNRVELEKFRYNLKKNGRGVGRIFKHHTDVLLDGGMVK